jgi:hypothetical protein
MAKCMLAKCLLAKCLLAKCLMSKYFKTKWPLAKCLFAKCLSYIVTAIAVSTKQDTMTLSLTTFSICHRCHHAECRTHIFMLLVVMLKVTKTPKSVPDCQMLFDSKTCHRFGGKRIFHFGHVPIRQLARAKINPADRSTHRHVRPGPSVTKLFAAVIYESS